jgi:hypothetical protein
MALTDLGTLLYPDIAVISSPSNFSLDAAEEHGATAFAIPKTGTLLKIGWRLLSVASPILTLKISLETVADTIGILVATTDAGKTLYAANAQSAAIDNPVAGVRFDAINGASPSTGISVTKGDLVSFVVRCTARTSGSVAVAYDQYAGNVMGLKPQDGNQIPYWYTYLGGAGAANAGGLLLTLEYDTGCVYIPLIVPAGLTPTTVTWNSGSNPDRRGLKMTYPFGCKLKGAHIYLDTDEDVQVILYDSDEYTIISGFPITLQGNMRRANALGAHWVEFPTEPTLLINTVYRLVILPSTVTNVISNYFVPADDGAVIGMNAMVGGTNFVYTTFNGTPTSGSHAWTDTITQRPAILPMISQIDFPAAGGGQVIDIHNTLLVNSMKVIPY